MNLYHVITHGGDEFHVVATDASAAEKHVIDALQFRQGTSERGKQAKTITVIAFGRTPDNNETLIVPGNVVAIGLVGDVPRNLAVMDVDVLGQLSDEMDELMARKDDEGDATKMRARLNELNAALPEHIKALRRLILEATGKNPWQHRQPGPTIP